MNIAPHLDGQNNKQMIFKTLYKLFPTAMNKAVFDSQSKPMGFEKCEFAFVDSNGKRYYRFMNDLDIPVARVGMMELKLKEISMGLDGAEIDLIVEAMETAINKKDKRGLMSPDIGMIGHLIKEIKNRKQTLIHPELLMSMVSYMYIREDENAALIDETLHEEKIAQFTKDGSGGLSDFFLNCGLIKYLPYLKPLESDLTPILRLSEAKIQAMRDELKRYIFDEQSGSI
jgi:hypothetical protein